MHRLTDWIGEAIMVIEPDAYDSDVASIAASDNDAGVPIYGVEGVMFILAVGDLSTGDTLDVAVHYSSTGNASDAASSATGWTMSDAVFTQVDTDSPNEIWLLNVDINSKGIADAAGKLYAAATVTTDVDFCVIAIPYGMNRLPCTNENTIVNATA